MRSLAQSMRELSAGTRQSRHRRPEGPREDGPPAKLKTCRDPAGRYELQLPSEWQTRLDTGLFAFSPLLGSFARVDVVPASATLWKDLEQALGEAGLTAAFTEVKADGAKGHVSMGIYRHALEALARPLADGVVVLCLGNVVDARRSRALERYEDRVLAAIRSSLKTA
jgi:hypothetical protein